MDPTTNVYYYYCWCYYRGRIVIITVCLLCIRQII